MTRDAILVQLNEIVRDVLDNDEITVGPQTTAADVPGWDSFAHINILIAAEMRFGIKFRTAEVELMKNVGDFAAMIEQKTGAPG